MKARLRPALLLDRDGVINVDRGYVCRLEDFEWLPGIFDVARTARGLGYAVVVVTNQSGIGRGYYTEQDYQAVTAMMRRRFEDEGAPIEAIYHCPFHPEAVEARYRHPDHPWRKPRPGMILAAQQDLGLDLRRSALVGDRWSDVEAGAAAGVGALGIVGNPGPAMSNVDGVERFTRVNEVVAWLSALTAGAEPGLRRGPYSAARG